MSHPSQPNSRVRQSHALSTPRISVLIAIGIGIAAPVPAQSPVLKADSLVLERTGCFAICPQYQVRIAKSGEVLVRTGGRVRAKSGEVIFRTSGPVEKRQLRGSGFLDLLTFAALLDFLELPEVIEDDSHFCRHKWTDHPSAIITVFYGNNSKRVDDYQGCRWAPVGLRELEAKVDSVAGMAIPRGPHRSYAGTYSLFVCKQGPCEIGDTSRAATSGFLVLSDSVMAFRHVPDSLRLLLVMHGVIDGAPNACYALRKRVRDVPTYAGSRAAGVTHWELNGAGELLFGLYRSPDAGHQAHVRAFGDTLRGRGQSWGAGTAAVDYSSDTLVAIRIGPPDPEVCVAASSRELRERRAR